MSFRQCRSSEHFGTLEADAQQQDVVSCFCCFFDRFVFRYAFERNWMFCFVGIKYYFTCLHNSRSSPHALRSMQNATFCPFKCGNRDKNTLSDMFRATEDKLLPCCHLYKSLEWLVVMASIYWHIQIGPQQSNNESSLHHNSSCVTMKTIRTIIGTHCTTKDPTKGSKVLFENSLWNRYATV